MNFENAIRGMRNPLASWDKSDSYTETVFMDVSPFDSEEIGVVSTTVFILGEKDETLALKLIHGGSEHRKFLRQIMVSVDITAPLYWWKEFDTYKVGTTANSTSTMHKVMAAPFTLDMFEWDDFAPEDFGRKEAIMQIWIDNLSILNSLREVYLDTQEKFWWKELIRLLPSSWLQTRTITMDYENLLSMYYHRRNHKLTEWHQYCDWIETLPYAQKLFGIG